MGVEYDSLVGGPHMPNLAGYQRSRTIVTKEQLVTALGFDPREGGGSHGEGTTVQQLQQRDLDKRARAVAAIELNLKKSLWRQRFAHAAAEARARRDFRRVEHERAISFKLRGRPSEKANVNPGSRLAKLIEGVSRASVSRSRATSPVRRSSPYLRGGFAQRTTDHEHSQSSSDASDVLAPEGAGNMDATQSPTLTSRYLARVHLEAQKQQSMAKLPPVRVIPAHTFSYTEVYAGAVGDPKNTHFSARVGPGDRQLALLQLQIDGAKQQMQEENLRKLQDERKKRIDKILEDFAYNNATGMTHVFWKVDNPGLMAQFVIHLHVPPELARKVGVARGIRMS